MVVVLLLLRTCLLDIQCLTEESVFFAAEQVETLKKDLSAKIEQVLRSQKTSASMEFPPTCSKLILIRGHTKQHLTTLIPDVTFSSCLLHRLLVRFVCYPSKRVVGYSYGALKVICQSLALRGGFVLIL
eukprot:2343440-Amphidinium_carterae.1